MVADAAAQGAQLIIFPEAFIPAYPRGLGFGAVVGSRSQAGRRTWQRYWANSVDVPGPATEALGAAAREAGAYLAIGAVERDTQYSQGTLHPACVAAPENAGVLSTAVRAADRSHPLQQTVEANLIVRKVVVLVDRTGEVEYNGHGVA